MTNDRPIYLHICIYVDNPNNSRTGLDIHGLNTRRKNQLSFQLQTSQLFKLITLV